MASWEEVQCELGAWAAAGLQASLWWRDDDAVEPSPALERLLGLAAAHRAPLSLAVIPVRLSGRLPGSLVRAGASVTLLQHGYAHRNHAPPGAKKRELGDDRPAARVLEELARGATLLEALMGPCGTVDGQVTRAPVLVPPWNRIDPGLLPALPGLGLTGISTHGPRRAAEAAPGLVACNSHVDILRWSEPRGFVGEAEALARLLGHLRARRQAGAGGAPAADPDEPTGLLTHHQAHDEAAWAFLQRLLALLTGHPAVRLLSAWQAFGWTEEAAASRVATGAS